jgi:hypothetical protein
MEYCLFLLVVNDLCLGDRDTWGKLSGTWWWDGEW